MTTSRTVGGHVTEAPGHLTEAPGARDNASGTALSLRSEVSQRDASVEQLQAPWLTPSIVPSSLPVSVR